MKKSERQAIFDKYGGKCAYCGCDLVKGWHVDHKEPVGRRVKLVKGGYWATNATNERIADDVQITTDMPVHWVMDKMVPDGFDYPERDCVENYMPACASCNINKHSMGLEDFRELVRDFVKSLNTYSTQYKIAKRYGLVREEEKPVVFYFETILTYKDKCK